MKLSISDIITYQESLKIENQDQVSTLVTQVSFIFEHMIEIPQKIILYEYSGFDPLVGENLCQIRAFIISMILKEGSIFEKISEIKSRFCSLTLAKESIANYFSNKQSEKNTVKAYLENAAIYFKISFEVIFLYISFVLSKYSSNNKMGIPDTIDPKYMAKETGISKELSKKIIKLYQRMITKLGCDIMLKSTRQFHPELEFLIRNSVVHDTKNRLMIPCHLVSKFILGFLLKLKIPIFLDIHFTNAKKFKTREMVCLIVVNNSYRKISFGKILEISNHCSAPFFAIKCLGHGNFESIFSEHNGFEKVFMSNMAMHPQFTNGLKKESHENPYDSIIAETSSSIDNAQKETIKLFRKQFFFDIAYSNIYNSFNARNPNWLSMLHIYCLSQCAIMRLYESKQSILYE